MMTLSSTILAVAPLAEIDVAIIAFYLFAVLVLGVLFSRYVKSSGDFFLAGKSLPFWAIGMSVVVSDIGAIDMVTGAGSAYKYGIAQANFDWIGSIPAMIIVAFVFVPFYWRTGVATLPEFLGRRYGPFVQLLQALIWLGFLLSMLAVMLWTSAVFLNEILGIETYAAIWLTAIVVGVYTSIGGLTAVVLTDVIQTVILFVGAAALLVLSFVRLGGWDELVQTVTERGPEFADHFQLLLPTSTTSPYPWSGIVFGLGIVLSTAYFSSNQAVIQRVLGARSEWHAKASLIFAGLLKIFIPVLMILPGLVALALHPDLEKADTAVPRLVGEVLPPGLLGLVFAAFLAALMSSVDSYLNSSTTIIISDLVLPGMRSLGRSIPDDRQVLRISRTLTLVLIGIAAAIAPWLDEFETIYSAMQTLFSLFQGPTLALLTLGIFWKRTNSWGGAIGLSSGVALATYLNTFGKDWFPSDDPFLFVAFWTFIFSLFVTALVSSLTAAPPAHRTHGLVWGSFETDENVQALLRSRMDSDEDPPRGEEPRS